MNNGATELRVELDVNFKAGRRGRRQLTSSSCHSATAVRNGRLPRVTRLMALAIRFDDLLRKGEVRDYANIARLGHVTRARVTQIMNLLHLAPDIQESILGLPMAIQGRDHVTERDVRVLTRYPIWENQRDAWQSIHEPARS